MGMILKNDGDGWHVGGKSTFITLMPVDFDTSVKADSSLGYFAVGDMREICKKIVEHCSVAPIVEGYCLLGSSWMMRLIIGTLC